MTGYIDNDDDMELFNDDEHVQVVDAPFLINLKSFSPSVCHHRTILCSSIDLEVERIVSTKVK